MVSKYKNPTADYTTLLLSIIVVLFVGIIAIAIFGYASMFGMMNGMVGGMMNSMMSGSMAGSASGNSIGIMGSSNTSGGAVSNMMGG